MPLRLTQPVVEPLSCLSRRCRINRRINPKRSLDGLRATCRHSSNHLGPRRLFVCTPCGTRHPLGAARAIVCTQVSSVADEVLRVDRARGTVRRGSSASARVQSDPDTRWWQPTRKLRCAPKHSCLATSSCTSHGWRCGDRRTGQVRRGDCQGGCPCARVALPWLGATREWHCPPS